MKQEILLISVIAIDCALFLEIAAKITGQGMFPNGRLFLLYPRLKDTTFCGNVKDIQKAIKTSRFIFNNSASNNRTRSSLHPHYV